MIKEANVTTGGNNCTGEALPILVLAENCHTTRKRLVNRSGDVLDLFAIFEVLHTQSCCGIFLCTFQLFKTLLPPILLVVKVQS